jgi:protein arginine kinase
MKDQAFDSIVLSTRIRLARNLKDHPFPARLSVAEKKQVNAAIRDALLDTDCGLRYLEMNELSPVEAVSLAEKHLISPEFASNAEGRALLLSEDETVSIMLCEEDHVRIQVIEPGLSLETAYGKANALDEKLASRTAIAFDEKLGYLTQCPTNLGTALRASVMLHLPALSRAGLMPRLSSTIAKLGLTLRGTYGEGSKPVGEIFQLSNQVTLGISEQAAIQNLASIAKQIMEQEAQARQSLKTDNLFIDKIYRAYGILTSAYMLSCSECTDLLSLVRLGAALGILDLPMDALNRLLTEIQPATLQAAAGRACTPAERDVMRAQKVKETLQSK